MIAKACKKLRHKLEEVAKAEAREKIVEQLELRHGEILTLKETVLSTTEALAALTKRTEMVGKVDATKAYERVQKVREALKADPLSITKGRDFTYMKSAFQKFSGEVEHVTEETWDQYKPRAKPSVDTNQIAEAEQQEAFKAKASQLKARAKYADQLGKKPPETEQEFAELEEAWQDVRDLIEELPAVASDPKVREFLKAANSSKGAALELLTDEVRQWLAENNTADKYRIINM